MSFEVQTRDSVSPTLGSSQLASGLLAGLIGLILVVIYSFFQYRLLASVTIASIVVAAVITYLVISILSWREGYRLSLAGVAGLIVAIGFTVDSFIVYFERIRDELRDGRGLVGAVEAGWKRALRTIYAAKGVNLLSAVVLAVIAVGSVQGLRADARHHRRDRRARRRAVHPPDLAAHRDNPVLLQRPPAQRPRPERARRGLPRSCGVPHLDGGTPRRRQP